MPTPGQELGSIPFESMLGGPLIACVNAQAQAAMSAVNFIKEVGFKKLPVPAGEDGQDPAASETSDPIYVTFKYPKEVSPFTPAIGDPANPTFLPPYSAGPPVLGDPAYPQGRPAHVPAKAAAFQVMQLEVPILTMLPIPYLRIEDVTIDFNAKIDSVEYQKIDTSLAIGAKLEVKQRWTGGSAKLNVSVAYKRNTQQGESVQRTYSMAVHIKAVQDEMPAGMQKVLDILESNMRSQPVSAPTPVFT